jgi:predicted DNA-binding protein with PD1-like motif
MDHSTEGLAPAALHRRLTHAGPSGGPRLETVAGPLIRARVTLRPGQSLAVAVGQAAAAQGITAGAITLTGARLDPVRYVMPTYARTAEHVAYYSDTYAPEAGITLTFATATFGFRDGSPFLHCHALWTGPDGAECGGHILPLDTVLAEPLEVEFTGTAAAEMRAGFDPETRFTLFRPLRNAEAETDGPLITAHIRPNEDFVTALERIAARHGIAEGRILSGIGSTVGCVFEDGTEITEIPTELLVTEGRIITGGDGQPRAEVTMVLIDAQGGLTHGRPARGLNPVLICAEIFIETLARTEPPAPDRRL